MSEREYIEYLLQRALAYIDAIQGELAVDAIDGWSGAKFGLSAHTMRDLCRLWIESDDAKKSATQEVA